MLLLCMIVFLLSGCDAFQQPGSDSQQASEKDLLKTVDVCISQGQRFQNLLMDETAAYFYGFAGSAAGSMRLAVEHILWLKGEGDSFDALTAGSRYTDWDPLGELCFASPYPYYFEGLLYDVQGMEKEAGEAYSRASIMTNFPDGGLDFYYLKDMSVTDLYALRDKLRATENGIYEYYSPVIYGYERSVYASSAEYLLLDAYELLEHESYEAAMVPARYGIRQNPKNEDGWVIAVTAAMYADEPYQAAKWLEEGLKYFPKSEGLGILRKALTDISAGAGAEGGVNG